MKIFVFGNGNICFNDFNKLYINSIKSIIKKEETLHFILCDFKGTDTLMMEFLKCISANVTIYHIGNKPRYIPDKFKTNVGEWTFIGGFNSDKERDNTAIDNCTHFLAYDFNSNATRKSGTRKNIEICLSKNKIFVPNNS